MPDAVWIVALFVIALIALIAILLTVHKYRPESFRLSATIARFFSFTLVMTASGNRPDKECNAGPVSAPGLDPQHVIRDDG